MMPSESHTLVHLQVNRRVECHTSNEVMEVMHRVLYQPRGSGKYCAWDSSGNAYLGRQYSKGVLKNEEELDK